MTAHTAVPHAPLAGAANTSPVQPRAAAAATAPATLPKAAAAGASVFLPLLLLSLALVAWFSFQTAQLVMERQQLGLVQASVEPQAQQATKLRASLDAVASATAKLATEGNANARVIVEELRKRGVTINPAAAPAEPAKAN